MLKLAVLTPSSPDFTDNFIMKNGVPSQNWRKRGKLGGGHYEKRIEKKKKAL
jgi:hypothetical protein